MKTVQKVFLGVAALCVFVLTLISLSAVSDAKTFDSEQLDNLKTHLEQAASADARMLRLL